MAERQALLDAVLIRGIHGGAAPQPSAAFRSFRLAQVAPTGASAQNFPASRNLESLGRGLIGLDAFWTSHTNESLSSKKSAQYRSGPGENQAIFWLFRSAFFCRAFSQAQ